MKTQKVSWSIMLHNIRSVQNVASIFRLAECFGVERIYLSGITPGPLDRFGRPREDFEKVSLGTEKIVLWERIEDVNRLVESYKKDGVVIALEQSPNSVDYKKVVIEEGKKYLLIPGREVDGLEQVILRMADIVAEIPQYGQKESLNIFSATSIVVARFFDK